MRFFLAEIPLIFLFAVCIRYNSGVETSLKLYPLMLASAAGAVFIALYFFRAIRISYSEICYIGKFSSHDRAVINKGKTLIMRLGAGSTVKVELFGNDGHPPLYSSDSSSHSEPIDINLFRGTVIGGERSVRRVLEYFGASKDQSVEMVASECSFEFENVNISSHNCEKGLEIRIFMKNTV